MLAVVNGQRASWSEGQSASGAQTTFTTRAVFWTPRRRGGSLGLANATSRCRVSCRPASTRRYQQGHRRCKKHVRSRSRASFSHTRSCDLKRSPSNGSPGDSTCPAGVRLISRLVQASRYGLELSSRQCRRKLVYLTGLRVLGIKSSKYRLVLGFNVNVPGGVTISTALSETGDGAGGAK